MFLQTYLRVWVISFSCRRWRGSFQCLCTTKAAQRCAFDAHDTVPRSFSPAKTMKIFMAAPAMPRNYPRQIVALSAWCDGILKSVCFYS